MGKQIIEAKEEKFGRYRLVRRIATGGMAEIFLARQTGQARFDKEVVVKRILPQYADHKDFVAMFLDEAALAARLNHPNIVQIFDVGREGNSYFLAMEYISGCDLHRLLRTDRNAGKGLPLELGVRIICDACAGLHYAHEMTDNDGNPLNIVHRDVSPQNLLISYDGAVKVADFGIAKAQSQIFKTKSGVLKGKYSYMSPEQALGKELDRRSDIFSLGIILYEAVTGQRLYKMSSELLTLKSIVEGEVLPPTEIEPSFPVELEKIIMRTLEKEPGDRFSTARELQGELESFLAERRLPGHHLALAEHMESVFKGRRPYPGMLEESSDISKRLTDSDWSISSLSGESSSLNEKVKALEDLKSASGLVKPETDGINETAGQAGPRSLQEEQGDPTGGLSGDIKLKAAIAILVATVVGLLATLILVLAAKPGPETTHNRPGQGSVQTGQARPAAN
ncbi:MAG: serine/threonine protein kinase [Deltaproteobacteria bacterium]|nr:serine/threonine protein kinase [Deltaproteobacteria bacterium]